ncbi:hypothetical protein C8Q70DRAFT_934458 [Cubamyces menziesii]|nr:hypothetical protein C8Q70DRAFT_934458 [Cubamyces menziesii]
MAGWLAGWLAGLRLHSAHPDGTANLQAILDQIHTLASPPANARSFLVTDVYGRGVHTHEGDAMVQTVVSGLAAHRANASAITGGPSLNFAFAEFSRIWDGVLGADPGYAAFGYMSTDVGIIDSTIQECTANGMCDDPDHYCYYIPGLMLVDLLVSRESG